MSNKSITNIECGCPMNKIIISFSRLPFTTQEQEGEEKLFPSVHEKLLEIEAAMRPECLSKEIGRRRNFY